MSTFVRPLNGTLESGLETILVVENDAVVQATVVDMLTALGYCVFKADDGESALMLLQGVVQIDMLFADVVMPGPLRSADLARQAQELWPDIALLFTSASPKNVHDDRLDAGIELLGKPYGSEQLASKLSHVLAKRGQRVPTHSLDTALLSPEPPPDRVATGLRILVVEDNLDALEMVCELVGMLGHTVSGVPNAERAWELLSEQDFDILFTDVNLPGLSGIDLVQRVIRDRPATRIIFSTGHGREALGQIGFKSRYLRKPYDLTELKAALDSAE